MGLGGNTRLQGQFHCAEHGLFIVVQHQGQDIDHFAVPARLAQYLGLQHTEGFGHLHERGTIAQRSGLALNHRKIMAPIVDDPPRLTVRPLNNTLMRTNDMPLSHNNQTLGVNAQADRAVLRPARRLEAGAAMIGGLLNHSPARKATSGSLSRRKMAID